MPWLDVVKRQISNVSNKWYDATRLKSSPSKFYCRHHKLVERYEMSISQTVILLRRLFSFLSYITDKTINGHGYEYHWWCLIRIANFLRSSAPELTQEIWYFQRNSTLNFFIFWFFFHLFLSSFCVVCLYHIFLLLNGRISILVQTVTE
jgi:hypothetical protein